MSPTRVALVGLGPVSSPIYKPGEWGTRHLAAILASPQYELVAVCNSSVESSQRSIDAHKLSSSVKAYGSTEDLARNPDVDLVAIAVNIDKHYDLAKPVILAKKDVLLEFPATPSAAQTAELAALAKDNGVKLVISSQGRAEPAVRKLKELVEAKEIGRVVYSSFSGHIPIDVSKGWPSSLKAFLQIDGSISRVNINLSHTLDAFVHVLGGFSTVQSVFNIGQRTTNLLNATFTEVVEPNFQPTAPDTMLAQGALTNGGAANLSLRASEAAADGVGLRWVISGTEGELVYTGGAGFIQMGMADAKITLRKFGGEAQEVDFSRKEGEHAAGLDPMSLSLLRLYDAIAAGDVDGYSDIEQSLKTAQLLDEIKEKAIWAN
ncbi:putative oxidoreductase [Stachybotrys elegans]|uniref:Oxidoreductase n=1 Tax=Stachybotrys elegans TaxID=80388 RepID=A0A8K0SMZ9_9HYPO|nr:putative oxidoreductase [Stachybotrys elegans]